MPAKASRAASSSDTPVKEKRRIKRAEAVPTPPKPPAASELTHLGPDEPLPTATASLLSDEAVRSQPLTSSRPWPLPSHQPGPRAQDDFDRPAEPIQGQHDNAVEENEANQSACYRQPLLLKGRYESSIVSR